MKKGYKYKGIQIKAQIQYKNIEQIEYFTLKRAPKEIIVGSSLQI